MSTALNLPRVHDSPRLVNYFKPPAAGPGWHNWESASSFPTKTVSYENNGASDTSNRRRRQHLPPSRGWRELSCGVEKPGDRQERAAKD